MEESQPRKRTIEELQAKYDTDPEYHAAILDDAESQQRQNTLKQKFRLGAKLLCASKMWNQIEATTETSDPTPLSELLKIRRKEVYTLHKGQMTLEMLVALVSEVRLDICELNPLPSLQDRGVVGYQLVTHWIATSNIKMDLDNPPIAKEHLIATCLVLSDSEYINLCDVGDAHIDWSSLADRIQPRVLQMLNLTELSLDGEELKQIVTEWAEPIGECRNAISHRWIEEAQS